MSWLPIVMVWFLHVEAELTSLSELPLEALLRVKKQLTIAQDAPLALPLSSDKKGYYVHYIEEPSKPPAKKLFHLSISSLAFLAFGGYLLFLIIAAIKGKHYDYYDPNTATMMQAMVAEVNKRRRRKKKPYGNRYKEEILEGRSEEALRMLMSYTLDSS